jgi:hypothetical protein
MSDIAGQAKFEIGTLNKYSKLKEELYFTLINGKVEKIDRSKSESQRRTLS